MWAWSPSSVTPKAQFRPGYPANEACCQTKWFIELSSSRRDSLRSADSCCPSRSTDTALKGSSSEACAFVKRKHEASDSVHYWIFADLRVCGTGATCVTAPVLNLARLARLSKSRFARGWRHGAHSRASQHCASPFIVWGIWSVVRKISNARKICKMWHTVFEIYHM